MCGTSTLASSTGARHDHCAAAHARGDQRRREQGSAHPNRSGAARGRATKTTLAPTALAGLAWSVSAPPGGLLLRRQATRSGCPSSHSTLRALSDFSPKASRFDVTREVLERGLRNRRQERPLCTRSRRSQPRRALAPLRGRAHLCAERRVHRGRRRGSHGDALFLPLLRALRARQPFSLRCSWPRQGHAPSSGRAAARRLRAAARIQAARAQAQRALKRGRRRE